MKQVCREILVSLLPEFLRNIGFSSNEETLRYINKLLCNTQLDRPRESSIECESTLSGGGSPLELCLSVAGRMIVGFGLTVEHDERAFAPSLDAGITLLRSLGWENSSTILKSSALLIRESSPSLIRLFDSVSHRQNGVMNVKIYFAVQDDQFNGEIISRLRKAFQLRESSRIDRVARGLALRGPDIVCLSFFNDRLDGMKCYFTKPYIHLQLINRFALSTEMSIRSYISLLRWYHIVAERRSGRLGLFGFGIKTNVQSDADSLEVYCYGRNEGKEDFSKRVERIVRSRMEANAWRMLAEWRDRYFSRDSDETTCKMLFSGLSANITNRTTLDNLGIYLSFQ